MYSDNNKLLAAATAERGFEMCVSDLKLIVSKPLVPTSYDCLVDVSKVFVSVQIKLASKDRNGNFRANLTRNIPKHGKSVAVKYKPDDLDIFAVFVESVFYLFPNSANLPNRFYVSAKGRTDPTNRWAEHLEDWHLLYRIAECKRSNPLSLT